MSDAQPIWSGGVIELLSAWPRRAERQQASEFQAALVAQLPRLRRYAIALIGNVSVADDLVQDCVERALRRQDMLTAKESLYGWLRSILHNLYIDGIRRDRRQGVAVDLEALRETLASSASAADTAGVLDLARAMSHLSPDHRRILLLNGLEGLSYREIAEELEIPLGTVMSRLARAREQLRLRLDGAEA